MQLPAPCGVVSLLSDFGRSDPYAGIMAGAVLRAHPQARVVELCHDVPPQDLQVGGTFLAAAASWFPTGTVHVAVVDPGVGTGRRILALCAHDAFWLLPDNGLGTGLWRVAKSYELREVDCERLGLSAASRTFHGRDLFAPVAGMLSRGRCGFRALGPVVRDPVELEPDPTPRILLADRFGNLISNVRADDVPAATAVALLGRRVPLVPTYGAAAEGELVAVVSSFGTLEVAAVGGDAAAVLGAGPGTPIEVIES